MQRGEEFIIDAKTKEKFIPRILLLIELVTVIILVSCAWIVMKPDSFESWEEMIDSSIMGEEVPIKIVTLNSSVSFHVNYEMAYILGDKGNLYVLCCDSEKLYVDVWHPEFWKDIEIVDICAERPWSHAVALDKEGNVYVWEKEYLIKKEGDTGIEINKRENWEIQKMENIPKVKEIYAIYGRFVIVTEENVCMWAAKEHANPNMEDMERIDIETPIVNVAASKEAVYILDEEHVLWSLQNGNKKVLQENVKYIMQGGKGFVFQLLDAEKEVYVCDIELLSRGHETVALADGHEAAKIVFEDKISSIAVNGSVAIVCTDKQEYYRWGQKQSPHNRYTYVPSISLYTEPVKIDLVDVKYYMLIGRKIICVDSQNRMFFWILN